MASNEQVNYPESHPLEDEGPHEESSFPEASSSSQKRRREGEQDGYAEERSKMQRASSLPEGLQRFRMKDKPLKFQSYDGLHGSTDKVVHFIRQFDIAFAIQDYMESTKMHIVEMHLTKTACNWWMDLKNEDLQPKTWELCRVAMWKHFLTKQERTQATSLWLTFRRLKGESDKEFNRRFKLMYVQCRILEKLDKEGLYIPFV